MKYDLYIQQQCNGCQKGEPARDEHLQDEICRQDKARMEEKEEQLQPSAYDDWVVCPGYDLRSGRQQRQKWRILNGPYLARLVEQAIAFALSYGSPQYVVHRPVPAKIEGSSPPGNPQPDNHNNQRQHDEVVDRENLGCMAVDPTPHHTSRPFFFSTHPAWRD